MRPQTFSLTIVLAATALFGGTVATNLLLDPQGVFNSNLFKIDLTRNFRFARFAAYRAGAAHYDAFFFASSRGGAFDLQDLARRMNVNAVADFSVPGGSPSDFLPMLRYAIRDNAERSQRLRSVFMLLDADIFGQTPRTNRNIDSFLPPALTGEHPVRIWWQYLTAFQYRVWREVLIRAMTSNPATVAAPIQARTSMEDVATLTAVAAQRAQPGKLFETQPYLREHISMLADIVALCRDHQISLTVAFTPLNRANADNYDREELAQIIELTSRVVALWDFGEPDWLSDRSDLWDDPSHFGRNVSTMMLDRIFGPAPSAPFSFGTRRGP